jgi:protein-tyrosine-phosphatase
MTEVRRTFDYLLLDCCRGRPEFCSPVSLSSATGNQPMSDRKYKVLFICTGNSARSIFAESILRKEAGDRFEAYSAGTRPRSELNPFALDVLEQKGHDISVLRSKTIAEFQGPEAPKFDFVFTVCNQAANEECPAWSGQPVSAHWGMPDPVKAEGTDAEKASRSVRPTGPAEPHQGFHGAADRLARSHLASEGRGRYRPDRRRCARMTVYALNGLGRIGKLALKPLLERGAEIAWINDAVGDPAMHAHLLEFDTVHGRWDAVRPRCARRDHRRQRLPFVSARDSVGAAARPASMWSSTALAPSRPRRSSRPISKRA